MHDHNHNAGFDDLRTDRVDKLSKATAAACLELLGDDGWWRTHQRRSYTSEQKGAELVQRLNSFLRLLE